MKTVVIIGNGFDLDLGLKTSYRDFVMSQECKKLRHGNRNNLLFNDFRQILSTKLD